MLEEFLKTLTNEEDDYISDYWLFEDDYIKEVRYKDEKTKTYIYELDEFIEENPNHPILEKLKQFRQI